MLERVVQQRVIFGEIFLFDLSIGWWGGNRGKRLHRIYSATTGIINREGEEKDWVFDV